MLWLGLIVVFAVGCQKEPLQKLDEGDPVMASVVSTEETDLVFKSAFTAEEWNAYEELVNEALFAIKPGIVSVPINIVYPVSMEYRDPKPEGSAVMILNGAAYWDGVGDSRYMEHMYKAPEALTWEGEGRIHVDRYLYEESRSVPTSLFFETGPAWMVVGEKDYLLTYTSNITFRGGTDMFEGCYGEGIRKIVVDPWRAWRAHVYVAGYIFYGYPAR